MIQGISLKRLKTCHPDLQRLVIAVDQLMPCSVVCGHRGQADQDQRYADGLSCVLFPNGKHNSEPSMAVDLIPYFLDGKDRYDWDDKLAFARLAGVVDALAHLMVLKVRWGGDWDRDGRSADQTFMDLGHFELVE